MALGRPISLTNNVASKIIRVLATNNQTVFTVVGGYRINQIGVFRNGVRLSNNSDFTALDGSTVTLINAAQTGDEVLFEVQDDFRVSDAIVSAASTQTIGGNLSITGDVSIGGSITGTIDATSFNATSGTFSGNLSVGGTLSYEDVTNIDSIGIITARSDVSIADKIVHTGDTNTAIRFPANDTFAVETAGTERLRINSDGRILIGDILTGDVFGDLTSTKTLSVVDTTNGGLVHIRGQSPKLFFDVTAGGSGEIYLDSSNFKVLSGTPNSVGTERLRIDSSGRLLIGTTTEGEGNADDLTVATSGSTGITIRSGTTSYGSIYFSDATSGNGEYDGYIQYNQGSQFLTFGTAATERLRIDSDGRVLLAGATSSNTERLYVKGSSSTTSGIFIHNANGATNSSSDLWFGHWTSSSTPSAYAARISALNKNVNTGVTDLLFHVYDGGNVQERLRITSGGVVGINTTTAFDTSVGLAVRNGASGSDHTMIDIIANSNESSRLVFSDDSDHNQGRIQYNHTGNSLAFYTNGNNERLRIDSDGTFIFKNGGMVENGNIDTTARTGTQNANLDAGMVIYFSTASTGTWKPNFRISGSQSLNSVMADGDVISPTTIVAKGATSHYSTTIQIDGSDVTPKFLGGAPSDGGGSGTFDVYSYTIIKTANATFTVFASVSNYE